LFVILTLLVDEDGSCANENPVVIGLANAGIHPRIENLTVAMKDLVPTRVDVETLQIE